ncbi:hypothetical protein C7B80_13030 [Cyanosarcina cf. burmensis CCALA 770]|nr:hypothetical protein C7B80_13030 [Cyanosarcina cf. burmensis CCALA 770]
MKRLAFLSLVLSLLFPSSALALSARTIFAEQAQGTNGAIVTLEVSPGYGLNINLIPTGEVVKKAWIDDPSRIALSFDGNLCQWRGDRQQSCSNEGATVVHLRQIQAIQFQNLPRSRSGGTLLTLIAEGASGRKVYQFRVVPASGEPKYTALIVKPDSERSTPAFNRVPLVVNSPRGQQRTTAPALQPNSNTSTVIATRQEAAPKKPFYQPSRPVASPTGATTSRKVAIAPTPKQPATFVNPPASAPAQQVTNSHLNPSRGRSKPSTPAPEVSQNASTNSRKLEGTGTPATARQASVGITTATSTTTNTKTQPQQSSTSIEAANALMRGLVVARQKGQINHQTTMWRQVQSAVAWLRRGATKQEAALKAGVPLKTIDQLLAWGQVSPLSSLSSPEIESTQVRTN